MSIPNIERLKLRVLQQLKRKGTYGINTYKSISASTGIKYGTVKYLAKQLIAEGRINIAELKPENGEKLEENSDRVPPEIREQSKNEELSTSNDESIEQGAKGDIAVETRKEYIKKMINGQAQRNMVIATSYINYCRQNLNTKNLTSEDFEILCELISSDVNLMTAENIKLGILGFVRVNKIEEARKFFQKCSKKIQGTTKVVKCSRKELNGISEELGDYEVRLKIYTKLKNGYPVDAVLSDAEGTKVTESSIQQMAYSIQMAKKSEKQQGNGER